MLNLRRLSEDLQELGTAGSQRDVSALAGRRASWLSATLAHRRRPSTGSLVALLFNLKEIINETRRAAEGTADVDERDAYLAGAEDLMTWVRRIEDELTRRIASHEA